VDNLLYIVRIKVLAIQAGVSSVSTQGRQIVIKPQGADSPLKIREVMGVVSRYPDSAIRIGPTQIKLDTRLLGERWKLVLEELLSCNCA
jgi:transcription-repair coupling factor (superfamily II helicase)